jgi:hypothetical protein
MLPNAPRRMILDQVANATGTVQIYALLAGFVQLGVLSRAQAMELKRGW